MNFKDDKLTDNYVKPDTIEMYQVIRWKARVDKLSWVIG
jgi:hypothetical protein